MHLSKEPTLSALSPCAAQISLLGISSDGEGAQLLWDWYLKDNGFSAKTKLISL